MNVLLINPRNGSTLRATLIRSSYEPDPLPEVREHRINLALAPHAGRASVADLVRSGAGFNHPLQVMPTDVHAGALPPAGKAIVACGPANVVVSAVKKAEDDDAVIVRLFETAGRAAEAKVTLDGELMGTVAAAEEVDLLERPVAASTAKTTAAGFAVRVPGHGIASVKVTFEPAE